MLDDSTDGRLPFLPEHAATQRVVVPPPTHVEVARALQAFQQQEEGKKVAQAGGEWSRVKKSHESDTEGLAKLVAFRKQLVDNLIEGVKAHFGVAANSTGSTALTSDYDVTFSGPALFTAEAVRWFNEQFVLAWGKESGSVLDTNVYAQNFLGARPGGSARDDETSEMTRRDAAGDTRLQDVGALVKVRKNMSEAGWASFVERIVTSLPGRIQAENRGVFAQADMVFKKVYVKSMMDSLQASPQGRSAIDAFRLKHPRATDATIVEAIETENVGIQAANRIYEQKLAAVAEAERNKDRVFQRGDDDQQWSDAILKVRKAKAESMLFANEPYFSAGTLYHVVANLQANWGLDLGGDEYFQSANENFGDFKKSIGHTHGLDRADTGDDYVKFAISSSKYVYRFLDAVAHLHRLKYVKSDVTAPLQAVTKLLAIRQGDALDSGGNRINPQSIGAARDPKTNELRYRATAAPAGTAAAAATGEQPSLAGVVPSSVDYGSGEGLSRKMPDAREAVKQLAPNLEALDALLTEISTAMNADFRSAKQPAAGAKDRGKH